MNARLYAEKKWNICKDKGTEIFMSYIAIDCDILYHIRSINWENVLDWKLKDILIEISI